MNNLINKAVFFFLTLSSHYLHPEFIAVFQPVTDGSCKTVISFPALLQDRWWNSLCFHFAFLWSKNHHSALFISFLVSPRDYWSL